MAQITKEVFLRDFSKAIINDEAAIFVGAGMSAGAGFVDWRGLLREIAGDLQLDVDEEHDLIALAQYEYNRNDSRNRLNTKIIEEFRDRATLLGSHRWLARLPIDTVWTTNYDRLLEQAYADAGKTVDVKHRQVELLKRTPYSDVSLFKMHGDVGHPNEAVLIKDDYEQYNETRALFSERLRGDLSWRQFLFLGFSFTDPNIDYIFSRLRAMLRQDKDNQQTRYCIMRKPSAPKEGAEKYDALLAQFKRDERHLPHRIRDLGRFNIEVVLIDEYSEIEDLLRNLCLRVSAKNVFISGSAHEFSPVAQSRIEGFCRKLGGELISRGYNLVSGFGLGISGCCIIGAHEQVKRTANGRLSQRLRLHPFPQQFASDEERKQRYTEIRTELIKSSGVSIFIVGNKLDRTTGKLVQADGMLEEYRIANENSHILIPMPATGWAAKAIWEEISPKLKADPAFVKLAPHFEILAHETATDAEWMNAIFSIIEVHKQI